MVLKSKVPGQTVPSNAASVLGLFLFAMSMIVAYRGDRVNLFQYGIALFLFYTYATRSAERGYADAN